MDSHTVMAPPRYVVPMVPDEELKRRASRIIPLLLEKGRLWTIEPVDIEKVSFMWDPVITGSHMKIGGPYSCFANIVTYHSYGYHGFFKPTVAQVLHQIPEDIVDHVDAFAVIGPDDVGDLNNHIEELNAGYQVAITKLYHREV